MRLSTSLKGGTGTMACCKKVLKYPICTEFSQVCFCLFGCFHTTIVKYIFCLVFPSLWYNKAVVSLNCGINSMWYHLTVVSLQCGITSMWFHLTVVSLHCGIKSLAYHTLYYPITVVPLQCCPTSQSY